MSGYISNDARQNAPILMHGEITGLPFGSGQEDFQIMLVKRAMNQSSYASNIVLLDCQLLADKESSLYPVHNQMHGISKMQWSDMTIKHIPNTPNNMQVLADFRILWASADAAPQQ